MVSSDRASLYVYTPVCSCRCRQLPQDVPPDCRHLETRINLFTRQKVLEILDSDINTDSVTTVLKINKKGLTAMYAGYCGRPSCRACTRSNRVYLPKQVVIAGHMWYRAWAR